MLILKSWEVKVFQQRNQVRQPLLRKKAEREVNENKKLMSPDLVAETIYADGTISYSPPPPNNYYLGNVMSDPDSMVAVSDNGGLVN